MWYIGARTVGSGNRIYSVFKVVFLKWVDKFN